MLPILPLLSLFRLLPTIQSEWFTYAVYQTDDLCQYNWEGSICLPILSLNQSNQPVLVQVDINKHNPCPTRTLVYVRTRQCIYCSKRLEDIHCRYHRLRRMAPAKKTEIHQNSLTIISIGLLSILLVGSLFALAFIKRSKAHTNLLELVHPTGLTIKSINQIRVPEPIRPTTVLVTRVPGIQQMKTIR
jgi:hypothetical protein